MKQTPLERQPLETIFCSYAHEDEAWLQKLDSHLSGLKQQGLIASFHESMICAGDDRASTIDTHLKRSSLILLLISADFLKADYCNNMVQRALEQYEQGTARVVPIILGECDWSHSAIGRFQALPPGGKPVMRWENKDQAFKAIVDGLRRIITQRETEIKTSHRDTRRSVIGPGEQNEAHKAPQNGCKIENAINNARPMFKWMLCFIGENQATKLGDLARSLSRKEKQIPSGFSYWGINPAVTWERACNDTLYPVMNESIESFPDRWAQIMPLLDSQHYHYVSLGIGTGRKDCDILKSLHQIYPDLYYFPVDMSPEMLRIGVREVSKGTPLERCKILPIQLDFSCKKNIAACRSLLKGLVEEEPILFALLGNTLANFEHDRTLLKTLATLLRPQDRFLLEVASTEQVDESTAQAAADEYTGSPLFRDFVVSSLRQNTNLQADAKDIDFLGSTETTRSLRIEATYTNKSSGAIDIVLSDASVVGFAPHDKIRLLLSRKYTSEEIRSVIHACGLWIVKEERCLFDSTPLPNNFGMDLLLLASEGG